MSKTRRTTILITEEQYDQLQELAGDNRRMSEFVRRALDEWLARQFARKKVYSEGNSTSDNHY